MLHEYVPYWL